MSDLTATIISIENEALRTISWEQPYRMHDRVERRVGDQLVGVAFEVKSLGSDHLRAQYWVGASYYLNGRALKKSQLVSSLQVTSAAPGAKRLRNFGTIEGAKQ